ncbi:MAG: altronate dehydratase [Acidobacteria bacterium]|nr:altronate dehydratase [Acidobacteriota bacterium]
MRREILRLDARDNVLIALRDFRKGEQVHVSDQFCTLASDVPAKHKFAVQDLSPGAEIVMYGVLVGRARESIRKGEILNSRNTSHEAAEFRQDWREYPWTAPDVSRWLNRTFSGFHRADGQTGTRNYWLVVPLVFCENRNILALKQAFEEELGFAAPSRYRQQVAEMARLYGEGRSDKIKTYSPGSLGTAAPRRRPLFDNVDGIKFLIHEGGCGGTHEDSRNLCGLLAGYIHHPNVAGATVLSLGCQHAQVDILRDEISRRNPAFAKPLFVFEQQKSASEFDMLSSAVRATFSGLIEVNDRARQPAAIGKLCIGLKCGGSDGFSGLSANPALGRTSDLVAALGGRTILSEFPELCGVEQELIHRCADQETAERFIQLMRDYAARAKAVRAGFEMNPSPGNVRDGLITDAMKSAGAAKKGGSSPVAAVLDYPEYSVKPGLNLQCTPGNDVECVTAQVGAGANVVLFTTGLGTPTGNPVCPVVKISSNSSLPKRMPDVIDIDCGGIISGEKTVDEMGEEILDYVVRVASGEVRTKAELLRQDDFIPWKRGVSL